MAWDGVAAASRRCKASTPLIVILTSASLRDEVAAALFRADFDISSPGFPAAQSTWNLPAPHDFLRESLQEFTMTDLFDRLKHAQIGKPIDQPLILAILIVLIAITLYLFA
jgi:hypothetical protein